MDQLQLPYAASIVLMHAAEGDGMQRRNFTLPELEHNLDALTEDGLLQITRNDYERLFGLNGAARGRLQNFARGHACVASFADESVLFRKRARAPKAGGS